MEENKLPEGRVPKSPSSQRNKKNGKDHPRPLVLTKSRSANLLALNNARKEMSLTSSPPSSSSPSRRRVGGAERKSGKKKRRDTSESLRITDFVSNDLFLEQFRSLREKEQRAVDCLQLWLDLQAFETIKDPSCRKIQFQFLMDKMTFSPPDSPSSSPQKTEKFSVSLPSPERTKLQDLDQSKEVVLPVENRIFHILENHLEEELNQHLVRLVSSGLLLVPGLSAQPSSPPPSYSRELASSLPSSKSPKKSRPVFIPSSPSSSQKDSVRRDVVLSKKSLKKKASSGLLDIGSLRIKSKSSSPSMQKLDLLANWSPTQGSQTNLSPSRYAMMSRSARDADRSDSPTRQFNLKSSIDSGKERMEMKPVPGDSEQPLLRGVASTPSEKRQKKKKLASSTSSFTISQAPSLSISPSFTTPPKKSKQKKRKKIPQGTEETEEIQREAILERKQSIMKLMQLMPEMKGYVDAKMVQQASSIIEGDEGDDRKEELDACRTPEKKEQEEKVEKEGETLQNKKEFEMSHMGNWMADRNTVEALLEDVRSFEKEKRLFSWKKGSSVFSENLKTLFERSGLPIPIVVAQCMACLRQTKGLKSEGIFRISAPLKEIERISSLFKTPLTFVNLERETDNPHVIACVLKSFFAKLPEPLIPDSLARDLVKMYEENQEEQDVLLKSFSKILGQIDYLSAVLFRFLIQYLNFVVIWYSETNKMTAENLAVCFGPILIRSASLAMMAASVVAAMITHYEVIFSKIGVEKVPEALDSAKVRKKKLRRRRPNSSLGGAVPKFGDNLSGGSKTPQMQSRNEATSPEEGAIDKIGPPVGVLRHSTSSCEVKKRKGHKNQPEAPQKQLDLDISVVSPTTPARKPRKLGKIRRTISPRTKRADEIAENRAALHSELLAIAPKKT